MKKTNRSKTTNNHIQGILQGQIKKMIVKKKSTRLYTKNMLIVVTIFLFF